MAQRGYQIGVGGGRKLSRTMKSSKSLGKVPNEGRESNAMGYDKIR